MHNPRQILSSHRRHSTWRNRIANPRSRQLTFSTLKLPRPVNNIIQAIPRLVSCNTLHLTLKLLLHISSTRLLTLRHPQSLPHSIRLLTPSYHQPLQHNIHRPTLSSRRPLSNFHRLPTPRCLPCRSSFPQQPHNHPRPLIQSNIRRSTPRPHLPNNNFLLNNSIHQLIRRYHQLPINFHRQIRCRLHILSYLRQIHILVRLHNSPR